MASLYKTFKFSIISTLVFYGFIGTNIVFEINQESIIFFILAIFFIYGSLFFSLAALNTTLRHRYVTFKYGIVSVISKWSLLFLAAILETENLFTIGIVLGSFLIAFTADILMFISIRRCNVTQIDQKILDSKPTLTDEDIQVKETHMNQLFYFIMLFSFTAVTIMRVDYSYDIVIHLVLWLLIIKYVKRIDRLVDYQFKLIHTFIYLGTMYIGLVSVSYFTDLISSTWLALVFTSVMYFPYLQFFIKEGSVISKYRDAEKVK